MALWSNTDADASKPKYLSDTLRNGQTVSDKDATFGVDLSEAENAANIAKGLNTPGWVKYSTYTDAQGNTRHKSEVLVVMKTITGDADNLLPVVITITQQPVAEEVDGLTAAQFSVAYTITGGVATVQWAVSTDGGATWTDIVGATGLTLTVATDSPAYVDGNEFRAVVTSGEDEAISDAVLLTVTV